MMKYKLILGSQSPRRQQLLKDLGFSYTVRVISTEETFPSAMPVSNVAEYLAVEKGNAHISSLAADELVVTADTTVVLDNEILNKPQDLPDAARMLQKLSNRTHQVISGVCLSTKTSQQSFSDQTTVRFAKLTATEIDYYVNKFRPLDKAGGYAIQEWIGMIGITNIEGSYFTVMGLPVEKLYRALQTYQLER
uniref:dTTP/UTP pyrophosphatase n=1 Tax=Roseihalotalea indica TaxID=2867963 RepID=A0AA49GPN3_9BACT|nr:Maf family nucleotide pyrophosphatase [Tunicatimonas sp. TK19036]